MACAIPSGSALDGLTKVTAINDDRLLRLYRAVVDAILRTNAFAPAAAEAPGVDEWSDGEQYGEGGGPASEPRRGPASEPRRGRARLCWPRGSRWPR